MSFGGSNNARKPAKPKPNGAAIATKTKQIEVATDHLQEVVHSEVDEDDECRLKRATRGGAPDRRNGRRRRQQHHSPRLAAYDSQIRDAVVAAVKGESFANLSVDSLKNTSLIPSDTSADRVRLDGHPVHAPRPQPTASESAPKNYSGARRRSSSSSSSTTRSRPSGTYKVLYADFALQNDGLPLTTRGWVPLGPP